MKDYLEIKISLFDLCFWPNNGVPDKFQRYINYAQLFEFFLYETGNKNAALIVTAGILSGEIKLIGTTLKQCEYSESECKVKSQEILFASGKRKGEVKETFKPTGKVFYCTAKDAGFGFADIFSVNVCYNHSVEICEIIKAQISKYKLKIKLNF